MFVAPSNGVSEVGWNAPLQREGAVSMSTHGMYRIYSRFETLQKSDVFGSEDAEVEVLSGIYMHSFPYTIVLKDRGNLDRNVLAMEWFGVFAKGPVLLTTQKPTFLGKVPK